MRRCRWWAANGEPRPLLGREDLDRALRACGTWVRTDVRLVDLRLPFQNVETIDGSVPSGLIAADVSIVAFRAGDAHLGGLVVVTDNAVRERPGSKLAWQATHDALTGLPNRGPLASGSRCRSSTPAAPTPGHRSCSSTWTGSST